MASEAAKNKAAKLLKKRASVSSLGSLNEPLTKANNKQHQGSMSTISFMAEPVTDPQFRPLQQLENTYRMGPDDKFPTGRVQHIMKDVLDNYLSEERYEPELARQMSKTLTDVVKAKVKEVVLPRYKIVSIVQIGQSADQGMRMGSRCLWDANNDSFATYEFKNSSLYAVAQVYGVYSE